MEPSVFLHAAADVMSNAPTPNKAPGERHGRQEDAWHTATNHCGAIVVLFVGDFKRQGGASLPSRHQRPGTLTLPRRHKAESLLLEVAGATANAGATNARKQRLIAETRNLPVKLYDRWDKPQKAAR